MISFFLYFTLYFTNFTLKVIDLWNKLVYTEGTEGRKKLRGLADELMITYHGTEINRGISMMKKQEMECSICNEKRQHWLGDGIYLYKDCLYAYRWIVQMYKDRFPGDKLKSDLLSKYSILDVNISYEYNRVFALYNPECYIAFEKCKEKCRDKAFYNEYKKKYKIVDALIFNIMFKKMTYGNNYDIVEAIFNLDSSYNSNETRIKNLSECQICIKNPNVITEISRYEIDVNVYEKKLHNFFSYRKTNNNNKYMTRIN